MLIGREEECMKLKDMIQEGLKTKNPLSIYISGAPGTGKTKTTNWVLDSFKKSSFHKVVINCVSTNRKADIERRILEEFNKVPSTISKYPAAINELFNNTKKNIILVFDEIDHLISRSNSFLYTCFEWPVQYNGKIMLIGIANSLDLTVRLLPKLKVKGISPISFIFQPYNTNQLIAILKDYIQDQSSMDEGGIQLCARKVASQTGDIRTAFSIVGQIIQEMEEEMFENNENVPIQTLNAGLSTPKKNSAKTVLKVFRQVQSSPAARSTLPEHSKILLAVIMRIVRNMKSKDVTKTKLMSAYEKACKQLNLEPVGSDGRIQALDNLETMGIINITGVKNNIKIKFVDDFNQARAKISDHVIVSTIDEMVF